MAKKTEETVAKDTSTRDTLRGAGCVRVWQAQPRGQEFSLECWMTSRRELLIVQIPDGGSVPLVYAELEGDTLEERLAAAL